MVIFKYNIGFLTDYCQETKDLGPLYNLTDYNLFYLYMVKYLTNMRYFIN